jgi:Cu(I)/Ag(I) efflux system protein CusF
MGKKPYYFAPDKLTIQPGDTVTFLNAQDDTHDVMFVNVPKGVDEMIMSPMMEKADEKFSYTFKVPGTYQFHCHPHEEMGMKGTIIVGAPSKPGTTVAMDHHKMGISAKTGSGHAAATALPQGTGKVNEVNAGEHTVNITHDPIKALNWPKMKMEFPVEKEVDLSGVKVGDNVDFTLKPVGEDYVVTAIHTK